MSRYAIYAGTISVTTLMLALALPGCGDECSRASDCGNDQVCYLGTCEAIRYREARCSSSADCNAEGSNLFTCQGGRCLLRTSTMVTPPTPDAGPIDGSMMGPRDGGGPTDATPGRDAGPRDGGPAGPRDGGEVRDGGPRDGGPGPGDGGPMDAMAGDSGIMPGGMIVVSVDGAQNSFNVNASAQYLGGDIRLFAQNANGDSIQITYVGQVAGNDTCADATIGTEVRLDFGGTVHLASTSTPPTCDVTIVNAGAMAGDMVTGNFTATVTPVGGGTPVNLTVGTINVVRTL